VPLLQRARRCARCRPLLFCVDGCRAYIDAIRKAFREPIPGRSRHPRLRAWDGIAIAQVVKQYAHKQVVGVTRRVVQGTEAQIKTLLQMPQGGGMINIPHIARLTRRSGRGLQPPCATGVRWHSRYPLCMTDVSGRYCLQLLHVSYESTRSALLGRRSTSMAAQNTRHRSLDHWPSLDGRRVVLFSGASPTLVVTETTWEGIKGYESIHCSMVHLTSVKCRAAWGPTG
jgi:hypothetical protein